MLVVAVSEKERVCSGLISTLCAAPRVQFRADLLQQRRAEKEAEELKQQKEEEEKQHRLEALLNKVDDYLLLSFQTT